MYITKLRTRVRFLATLVFACFMLVSCNGTEITSYPEQASGYTRFQASIMGVFDTPTVILGYAKTEQEFESYVDIIRESLQRQHRYFDIFNEYEGINNLRTINRNAGIEPVEVSQEIIDLLQFSRLAYEVSEGTLNIALGSVLRIWHEYRTNSLRNPEEASIPSLAALQEANNYTNIHDMIIDEEARTVFLKHERMSLDVGGIAKGYAAQVAIDEARAAGMKSALISVGGNVIAVGQPLDGRRQRWGVGIQDPFMPVHGVRNMLDTVFVNDMSVVSSGEYQRFFVVDGVSYHHIIDPQTLMPANHFSTITILHEDSKWSEIFTTAAFILPYESGRALLESHGVDAIWILPDGSTRMTEGYIAISREFGGFSSVDD